MYNGTVSFCLSAVRLSVPAPQQLTHCCRFAALGLAGRKYRAIAARPALRSSAVRLAMPRCQRTLEAERKLVFGARNFSVAAPKIWNSLPLSFCTCTSPDTVCRHLKTHYCQQAFQSTLPFSSCASDSAFACARL